MTNEIQAPSEDEREKFEAFVQRETGRTMDWHREGKTTGLEFAWACWQARADMSNVQPKGTPKLDEWDYLRKHGKWRNGVPDWARDYKGQMNDGIAKSAVIEELRAALTAQAPAVQDALEALRDVHALIHEAASTGFYCHDGDWAERLFRSQGARFDVLRAHGMAPAHPPVRNTTNKEN